MDIHSHIEKIFTSNENVEKVIEKNELRVREIDSKLKEIIEEGYFGILKSFEELIGICRKQIEEVRISGDIVLPEKIDEQVQDDIEEEIWDCFNQGMFFRAVQLALENLHIEGVPEILLFITDQQHFSVFAERKEETVERLAGFAVLFGSSVEGFCLRGMNLSENLVTLLLDEFVRKIGALKRKSDLKLISK